MIYIKHFKGSKSSTNSENVFFILGMGLTMAIDSSRIM